MQKKTMTGLAAAVALTTGLGLAVAAPASANGGNSQRTGSCSDGATWYLKASANRGGSGHTIQVTFRIRSGQAGQTWDWQLSDNGTVAATGESTTEHGNGSFTERQNIPNLRGYDKVVLDATNSASGESCHGHVLLNGSH